MKIAFVIPKDDDQHNPQNQYAQGRIFPPVGLARMAGIIGKQACVNLIDERIEPTNPALNVQIAIIFINSYNQQRACDLAHYYHATGCLVVMTGPMLSHSIDLADNVADCLFIGSGEDNLSEFLADYRKGKTRRFYRCNGSKATSEQNIYIDDKTPLSLAS